MKNCLTTEMKTLLHLKLFWVLLAVFLGLCAEMMLNAYSHVSSNIDYISSTINGYQTYQQTDYVTINADAITALFTTLSNMYQVFHPNMIFNNLTALLLGVGTILFPIMAVLYIGMDYGRSTVMQNKITFYGLKKVFVSKIIVILGAIVAIVLIALAIGAVYCKVMWDTNIRYLFSPVQTQLEALSGNPITLTTATPHNAAMLGLLFSVLIFYTFLVSLVTFLTKNSVVGIVSVFVFGYISLPFNFTPHNVMENLITQYLFQNSASMFQYLPKTASLTTGLGVTLMAGYFVLILCGLFVIARKQKN